MFKKKKGPTIFCLQEIYFKYDTNWLKGRKHTYYANTDTMEGGMAILKSDPVDFRANGMTLDKDGHKKKKNRVNSSGGNNNPKH